MTAVFAEEDDSVEIQTLLTMEDARTALPDLPPSVHITGLNSYPEEMPEQLFLSVTMLIANTMENSYLLQYDWRTGEIATLPGPGSDPVSLYGGFVIANGRYLMFSDYNDPNLALRLYDIANQTWRVYSGSPPRFFVDRQQTWSTDGNWLVLPDEDAVRLIAPDQDYEKLLFHGLDFCETAFWVNSASVAEPGP
jgi:hypothetical protein